MLMLSYGKSGKLNNLIDCSLTVFLCLVPQLYYTIKQKSILL
jgi:hypothetical protein